MDFFRDKLDVSIDEYDKEFSVFINAEKERQEKHIELIASENYASKKEILEAQGSVLTNKYAEGYPAKRYYGGCEFVDGAENLAIERAKSLFKAKSLMFNHILGPLQMQLYSWLFLNLGILCSEWHWIKEVILHMDQR